MRRRRTPEEMRAVRLRKSIAHWERMRDKPGTLQEWEDPKEQPLGSQCELCKAYCKRSCKEPCKGCPIFMMTGKAMCDDTPYGKAWALFGSLMEQAEYMDADGVLDTSAWRMAAQEEIDFLRSLMPKGK